MKKVKNKGGFSSGWLIDQCLGYSTLFPGDGNKDDVCDLLNDLNDDSEDDDPREEEAVGVEN